MNKLKVKVRAETKEQSDEIQKLANSIGIFRPYNTWALHKGWVCIKGKEMLLVCDSCPGGEDEFKTITLAELRDMVVLNRNDISDATHENSMLSYIKLTDGWYYFDNDVKKWLKSTGGKPEYFEKLKPIEKTMKEYLDSKRNYEFVLSTEKEEGFIEIPKGAEVAKASGLAVYFWKPSENKIFINNVGWSECDNKSIYTLDSYLEDSDVSIIWQRETVNSTNEYLEPLPNGEYKYHSNLSLVGGDWVKIPEGAERARIYNGELRFFSGQYTQVDTRGDCFGAVVWQREQDEPFLTPETTLNDQYTEIEEVRQLEIHGTVESKPDFNFEEAQAKDNTDHPKHSHYFINVSDVNEVDFYEIALRYNVTDPCIQHILKKCLAVGNRGHKDFIHDLQDIYDTAARALAIHNR